MCAGVGRRWWRPTSGWTPGQMRLWLVCWRLMEAGLPRLCQAVIDSGDGPRGRRGATGLGPGIAD